MEEDAVEDCGTIRVDRTTVLGGARRERQIHADERSTLRHVDSTPKAAAIR